MLNVLSFKQFIKLINFCFIKLNQSGLLSILLAVNPQCFMTSIFPCKCLDLLFRWLHHWRYPFQKLETADSNGLKTPTYINQPRKWWVGTCAANKDCFRIAFYNDFKQTVVQLT